MTAAKQGRPCKRCSLPTAYPEITEIWQMRIVMVRPAYPASRIPNGLTESNEGEKGNEKFRKSSASVSSRQRAGRASCVHTGATLHAGESGVCHYAARQCRRNNRNR